MANWVCPDCGRVFARAGQVHRCGTWTVDGHLAGKPAEVVDLFRLFADGVRRCGPFEFAPVRSQVGFRGTRRIFAGVHLGTTGLRGYLDLARRVDSPRFGSVTPYTKRLFVHSFTITSSVAFDAEFAELLAETYAVGAGEHLAR